VRATLTAAPCAGTGRLWFSETLAGFRIPDARAARARCYPRRRPPDHARRACGDSGLRKLGEPLHAPPPRRPAPQASADARIALAVLSRDLLPLGGARAALAPRRGARRDDRPRNRRPSRRELRHLARRRGPADLGRERLRRGLPP